MKISELLAKVDSLKSNNIDTQFKIMFLNEIEHLLYTKIFELAEDTDFDMPVYTEENMEVDLLVHSPYEDIYFLFLCAKIDLLNQEFTSYNNNISLFTNMFNDFAADYRRKHMPKEI